MWHGARLATLVVAIVAASATGLAANKTTNCPGGWINADQLGCFKLLHQAVNLSWIEAQQRCEEEGGYLAEPKTSSQAEFLYGITELGQSLTKIGHWWIGLTDLGDEGNWRWARSHDRLQQAGAAAATSWGPRWPNNKTTNRDDCAVLVLLDSDNSDNNETMTPTFHWEDHNCLKPLIQEQFDVAPICQRDMPATARESNALTRREATTPPPPVTSRCLPGWAEFSGHCYLPKTIKASWSTAEADCALYRGGHLASVHSEEENAFVSKFLSGPVWIGARSISHPYTSYSTSGSWSDGTSWDYTKYSGTIGYTGSTVCFRTQYSRNWDYATCESSNPYVCKI